MRLFEGKREMKHKDIMKSREGRADRAQRTSTDLDTKEHGGGGGGPWAEIQGLSSLDVNLFFLTDPTSSFISGL